MNKLLSFLAAIFLLSAAGAHAQSFITATPGTTICTGTSVTLSTPYSGTTDTFQWVVNSVPVSTDSAYITSTLANGDTVRCFVTGPSSFSNADSVIMTVYTSAPDPGVITGSSALCVFASTTLMESVPGGTWSIANAHASVSAGIVHGVTHGADTVYYSVSNACGTHRASFPIAVDTSIPFALFTTVGTPSYCAGTSFTFIESVPGGVWSSSDNIKATVNDTGLVTLLSPGAVHIIHSDSNACGLDELWELVTVLPAPSNSPITGDTSVCTGSTVTLHDTATGCVWSSSNPFFATVSSTGVVSGLLHGTSTIYYTVTNVCGSATDSMVMNMDIPALPIVGSSTLCQLTLGVLIDPLPGGTWSTDNILVAGPAIGGTLFGLTVGTANITYTVVNACGTTMATFPVTVIVCPGTEVAEVAATQDAVNIFPNPGSGNFTVNVASASSESMPLTITDVMGKKVKEMTIAPNKETELSLDQPDGIYFLTVRTGNGLLTTRFVIAK